MIKKAIPLLLHPHFTKIASFFMGYMLWFFIVQYQWITTTYQANIYFYNTASKIIKSPENVSVMLRGPRKNIHFLNKNDVNIHIDAAQYAVGQHDIILFKENLFLPDNIKLLQLIPSVISIEIST